MPYEIKKKGEQYVVFKEGTDKEMGTHPTEEEAKEQISALYAHENTKTVKFIDQGIGRKVRGYGILYGSVDLVGDSFTKDTFFGFERSPKGMPVFYGHSGVPIGQVEDFGDDEVGVWFDIQLEESNKYLEAVQKLVAQKRVGLSTGSLSHLVQNEQGNIKQWIVGEISLVVNPAEYKTIDTVGIKSLNNGENNKMSEGTEYTIEDVMDKVKFLEESIKSTNVGSPVINPTKRDGEYTFGSFLKAIKEGDEDTIESIHIDGERNHGVKSLNTLAGSDGGYLIPTQFVNQLMRASAHTAIVPPRAMVMPVNGPVEIPGIDYEQTWDEGHDPNLGGLKMYWTAEGAEDTQSQPEFRQITLNSYECTTSVPVNNKLLDHNAIGLESVLTELFGNAIAFTKDHAFIRGDGVGKPVGVLNADATLSSSLTDGAPTVSELADMYVRLLPECEDTAVWLINPLLFADLMTINADSSNTNPVTWLPDLEGRPKPMLFGMPVIRTKIMPGNYDSGGVTLVDFSKYVIADDLNIEIAYSPHAEFRKRQTLWRCTIRLDGQPMMNASVQTGPTSLERVSFCVKSS